ncbi:CoA-transferase family III domain-containing protein [Endogone sp. FLAS-F59071]|nr:CoA-transferase family III domain-containing protein [Endogone sp. FLAS-F59071]|eukprot:RUS16386.1 CoA-transferase family III domain-containing protein [Endogone sp. FLAS-F59071]
MSRENGRNPKISYSGSCIVFVLTERLVRRLADKSDVLIENFKPGTMEKWGLGPAELYASNPGLIYTRVSGYGQTGPYSSRPGYAAVCEGMGGFRYVNGCPGNPPVRPNISLGDSLAGLHAALGVVLGLLARDQLRNVTRAELGTKNEGRTKRTGQVIDVAIYEAVLNMMEGIVPEFDRLGKIRQPSGTTVTGIVPTNTYPCADGKHVIIGGNGDSIYKRLMLSAGRPDLATKEYETNADRVKHQKKIDDAIADWTRTLPSHEVLARLEAVSVPAGKIYDVRDIVEDDHIKARGMVEEVKVKKEEGKEWSVKVPGMSPVLEETPGETKWAGPDLGAHNREVLQDELGLAVIDLMKLQAKGVIGKTVLMAMLLCGCGCGYQYFNEII